MANDVVQVSLFASPGRLRACLRDFGVYLQCKLPLSREKMYEFSPHSVLEKLISFGPQNAGAKLCTDVNIYVVLVAN